MCLVCVVVVCRLALPRLFLSFDNMIRFDLSDGDGDITEEQQQVHQEQQRHQEQEQQPLCPPAPRLLPQRDPVSAIPLFWLDVLPCTYPLVFEPEARTNYLQVVEECSKQTVVRVCDLALETLSVRRLIHSINGVVECCVNHRACRQYASEEDAIARIRAFACLDVLGCEGLDMTKCLIFGGCVHDALRTNICLGDVDIAPLNCAWQDLAGALEARLDYLGVPYSVFSTGFAYTITAHTDAGGIVDVNSNDFEAPSTSCNLRERKGRIRKNSKSIIFQISKQTYNSIQQLLASIDLGPSAIAYDGRHLYTNAAGVFSFYRHAICCLPGPKPKKYLKRLEKYYFRGYDLFLPDAFCDVHSNNFELVLGRAKLTFCKQPQNGTYKTEFSILPDFSARRTSRMFETLEFANGYFAGQDVTLTGNEPSFVSHNIKVALEAYARHHQDGNEQASCYARRFLVQVKYSKEKTLHTICEQHKNMACLHLARLVLDSFGQFSNAQDIGQQEHGNGSSSNTNSSLTVRLCMRAVNAHLGRMLFQNVLTDLGLTQETARPCDAFRIAEGVFAHLTPFFQLYDTWNDDDDDFVSRHGDRHDLVVQAMDEEALENFAG